MERQRSFSESVGGYSTFKPVVHPPTPTSRIKTPSSQQDQLNSIPVDENQPNISISALQIGERVVFEDQEGSKCYGIVQWIGKENSYFSGRQDYQVIGIQTVSFFSCIVKSRMTTRYFALFALPWHAIMIVTHSRANDQFL